MMKLFTLMVLIGGVATTGCVSRPPPVTLLPVGPGRPLAVASHEPQGALVVYSATETASFAVDADTPQHSAYEIRSPEGALLKRVANQLGTFDTEPEVVALPPGRYLVAARGSSWRRVMVPVVIEESRTTFVHLDGSELPGSVRAPQSEFVSLPDGEIVGWRADEQK